MKIKDIPEDYKLITDSQEVRELRNIYTWRLRFDSLIVRLGGFGIVRAFGFDGITPGPEKDVVELLC